MSDGATITSVPTASPPSSSSTPAERLPWLHPDKSSKYKCPSSNSRLTQVDLVLFKAALVCLFFCTQQQCEAADRCLEMPPRKRKKMILRPVTRAAILPAGPDTTVHRYAEQINSVSKLFMVTGVVGENALPPPPPPPPTPKLSSNRASHYCPPFKLSESHHPSLPPTPPPPPHSYVRDRASQTRAHAHKLSLSLCEDVCTHF